MLNQIRFFALALLALNTLGALIGGWSLMTDPSGRGMQLRLEYLQHTNFMDYFIPGFILFIVNGVYGIIVSIFTVFELRFYPLLIFFQGILLCEWIVVQVLLLNMFHFLHVLQFIFGATLIILGLVLYRRTKWYHTEIF